MTSIESAFYLSQKREQAEQSRLLQSLNDAKDLEALLTMPEGRRFLRRVLALCGLGAISYVPGDTHATAFKEGQRNIGLWLEAQLQAQPVLYLQLLTEIYHDRASNSND
jgi:hypothetical protein